MRTEKKASDRIKTISSESAGLFSDFIREFPIRMTLITSWLFTKIHSVNVRYARWACWSVLAVLAFVFWPVTVSLGLLFILAHVLGDVDSHLIGPPVDIGTEEPKEKKEKKEYFKTFKDLASFMSGERKTEDDS